jgi:hypothetical protein
MPDMESTTQPTLVFVYNADSGALNTLLDIGHKIVSPHTYACNLCAITHSTFSMRGEWRRFVDALGLPVEFLHRDELLDHYGMSGIALPAVFLKADGKLSAWIGRDEIDRCRTLADLQQLIQTRLKAVGDR